MTHGAISAYNAWQPENEFLKTTVRLHGPHWHASGSLADDPTPSADGWAAPPPAAAGPPPTTQPVWVRCSDPDVVAGVHEQRAQAAYRGSYVRSVPVVTAGVHTQQLSRDAFTEGAPVKRRVGGGRPDAYTADDAYSGRASYIEP